MIQALVRKKEEVLSLYVFAFLIPLNPKWYGFGLILILLESIWKYKTMRKVEFNGLLNLKNPFVWLFIYYLLHWTGVLYSSNKDVAFQDLGMKSVFAILPLYFLIFRPLLNLNTLFRFLTYGSVFSVVIYLIFSFIHLFQLGSLKVGIAFSFWMHRGYYTTYLTLAATFLLIEIFKNFRVNFKLISGVLILFAGFYFAEAKTATITVGIIGLILFLQFMKQKLGWMKFGVAVATLVLLFWILVPFVLSTNNRFAGAFYNLSKRELDVTSIESTTARILLWETSSEIIWENIVFGVGTGDGKDLLQKRNFEKGYTGVAKANYNAHNQFINSWLNIGILGFLSLLAIFISLCLKWDFKNLAYIRYAVFILIMILCTECFLERQAGIIPFAFLVSCIGTTKNDKSVPSVIS